MYPFNEVRPFSVSPSGVAGPSIAAAVSYRISAMSTTWLLHPYAQVQQSFNGSDIEDGVSEGKGTKRFIVDFAGAISPTIRANPIA